MTYKCLNCEDLKKCKGDYGPERVGYVCGLAGEDIIDLFEWSGEYMSERVHNVKVIGYCDFKRESVEDLV